MDDTKDRTEERNDADTPLAKAKGGRWREEKMIRDSKTGKIYGPYLYERWREGGKCRSKYLGKVER